SLQKKSGNARQAAQEATQQLEKFSEAMQGHTAGQQLANAYKLKQMLDQQIQTLDRRAQGDEKVSDAALEKTAGEARDTIGQPKKMAEEEPTRDDFGPPLRDSLSGQNKVDLDARLSQLEQASRPGQAPKEGPGTQEQAGQAK